MSVDFRYSDYGNQEIWVDAHQGSSWCRKNKVRRFFIGSNFIMPAVGSDSFLVASQTLISNVVLGPTILSQSVSPGSTGSSTIGIVEDEVTEHGRYFYLHYTEVGGFLKPSEVRCFNSAYANELAVSAPQTVWQIPVTLSVFIEQSMRIVTVRNEDDLDDKSYLYFVISLGPNLSRIYYLDLPKFGDAASALLPTLVAEVPYEVKKRIYALSRAGDEVLLYVGQVGRSTTQSTLVLRHNPITNTCDSPKVLQVGVLPFPWSYACALGKNKKSVHLVLEPLRSWLDGVSSRIDDPADTGAAPATLFRKTTGSSWLLASLSETGDAIVDIVEYTGEDIVPWLGGAEADAQGGGARASLVPMHLVRKAEHPTSLAPDNSDIYAMTAMVPIRHFDLSVPQPSLENDAFVYRFDTDTYRPVFGNNRTLSNLFDAQTLPAAADVGGSVSLRSDTCLLVPGEILIEDLQANLSDPAACKLVGSTAHRHKQWLLADSSATFGEPEAGLVPDVPLSDPSDQNTSTDCAHGVQGDVYDPDYTVIAAWYTGGRLP